LVINDYAVGAEVKFWQEQIITDFFVPWAIAAMKLLLRRTRVHAVRLLCLFELKLVNTKKKGRKFLCA
jgi:hypothetical protein